MCRRIAARSSFGGRRLAVDPEHLASEGSHSVRVDSCGSHFLVGAHERSARTTTLLVREDAVRGVPSLARDPIGVVPREVEPTEVLPVDGRVSGSIDREVWVARNLSRELKPCLISILQAQVVERVGDDDLGLGADEVVAASGCGGCGDRRRPSCRQARDMGRRPETGT